MEPRQGDDGSKAQRQVLVQQRGHQIDWHWVRGHAGDPGNERADALANRGIDGR